MVGTVSSFLSPTFVPEDLGSVLIVASEGAEVRKGLFK